MSLIDDGKLRAAYTAASLVQHGMAVGLGSGTTSALVVTRLGERVRDEGLKFVGVPTSIATAELATQFRIPLRDLDDFESLDIDLDGADEVDPKFRLIKGRGGALLREKIIATCSKRRVIVVTPEKRVERLGLHAPVPVEISPVGARHVEARLTAMGIRTTLRRDPSGAPYRTDGGNYIVDGLFPDGLDDPEATDQALRRITGVFETGIFLGLCDVLIVGYADRVESLVAPS